MRIAAAAILAESCAARADAVDSLVQHYPVPWFQVADFGVDCRNHATDIVSEDLGLHGERDGLAARVVVVVGMAGENMGIGAANADRGNAHQNIPRLEFRSWNFTHLNGCYIVKHTCFHAESPETSYCS